jgi:hypothetical protein
MKRLLPVVISGVMAISFSQFAAAQGVGVQGQAGAGANVDLNSKGSTDAQTSQQLGQSRQQPGSDDTQSGKKQRDSSAATGATGSVDTSAGASTSPSKNKNKKDKDSDSSSGSSSGSYK